MMESRPFSMEDIGPVVFTTRIIVASLAAGILMFGLFVLVTQGIDLQASLELLTILSILFGVGAGISSLVVPPIIVTAQLRQIVEQSGRTGSEGTDAEVRRQHAQQLAAAFQSKTIVGSALLEGAAFFALVALMIEHHVASLIVAVIMLAGILSHLTTADRVREWIEWRLRRLDEMRSLSL